MTDDLRNSYPGKLELPLVHVLAAALAFAVQDLGSEQRSQAIARFAAVLQYTIPDVTKARGSAFCELVVAIVDETSERPEPVVKETALTLVPTSSTRH